MSSNEGSDPDLFFLGADPSSKVHDTVWRSFSRTLRTSPTKDISFSFQVTDLLIDFFSDTPQSTEIALAIYEDTHGDGSFLQVVGGYDFPWMLTSSSARLPCEAVPNDSFPPGKYCIGVWTKDSLSLKINTDSLPTHPRLALARTLNITRPSLVKKTPLVRDIDVDEIPRTISVDLSSVANKQPFPRFTLMIRPTDAEVLDAQQSIDVLFETIEKTNCLNPFTFNLDDLETFTLPSSSAILSSSPFFTDAYQFSLSRESFGDSKEAIRQLRIILSSDGECLLRVLFGENPSSSDSLFAFYTLFRELGLVSHAFAICNLLKTVTSLSNLYSLAMQTAFEFEESVSETMESDDEEEEEDKKSALSSLRVYPFAEELLRLLHRKLSHFKSQKRRNAIIRRYPHLASISIPVADPFWVRPIAQHPDFVPLFEKIVVAGHAAPRLVPEGISTLSRVLVSVELRRLHLNRNENTTVMLTTADGGEERAHLDVLIARSAFFRGMLHFEGREFTSYQENKTIQIEDMSHATLQALLVLAYGVDFATSDHFSLFQLLTLLDHAAKYDEKWITRVFKLVDESLSSDVTMNGMELSLIEAGYLLPQLPDDVEGRVKRMILRTLKEERTYDMLVRFSCRFKKKVEEVAALKQRVGDLTQEVESLRESAED